jgi:hypothetical protein
VIDALTAEQLEDLGTAARRIVAVANPEVAGTLAGSEQGGELGHDVGR